MRITLKRIIIAGIIFALCSSIPAWIIYKEISRATSEDPLVWESTIEAFEEEDKQGNNPEDAVVFVGSSSIRLWSSLREDMAPLPVIQRGFGGSKINDVLFYADRLINVHKPKAVVIFVGSNDITPGNYKEPETIFAHYKKLVARIRHTNKSLPIYYIGITPSGLRWEIWPIAQKTNTLIRKFTEQDSNLYFIDTSAALLNEVGEPNADYYRFDRLHLNKKGYQVWTQIIKPFLL